MTPRRALRLMALGALLCAALAGCGGGDDDSASSESLRSSLLPASEFPGYKLHRIYSWEDAIDFAVQGLPISQNTDPSDVVEQVQDADFSAGSGEELHSEDGSSFTVAVAQVGSEDKARELLDQIEQEALKQPCYGTCSERSEKFAVPGVPGAGGVGQVPAKTPVGQDPTAADAEPEPGAPPPFVAYGVGFTMGDRVYLVGNNGEPGQVNKDDLIEAAQKLYRQASSSGTSSTGDKHY